ncbi:MAG: aminoacyl-tRNA hydrolase [bacterium]
MKLIVGLGNPGKQYEKTRHNVGFMALDKLAEHAAAPYRETAAEQSSFKFVKKFNADIAICEHAAVLCGETAAEQKQKGARHPIGCRAPYNCNEPTRAQCQTIFAKPQTFMNLSGQSVQAIVSFYKINPEDIVVIHDDLDIELGEFKIQKNRSSAGHNGAQSIIDFLGTKDFTRIRIGIKNEWSNIVAEKFVLDKFNKEESKIIDDVIKKTLCAL